MAFCSKMFKPNGPFFNRLGQIWELQAQVEELVSLIIPEANRTKNPLIRDYAQKIGSYSEDIKVFETIFIDLGKNDRVRIRNGRHQEGNV